VSGAHGFLAQPTGDEVLCHGSDLIDADKAKENLLGAGEIQAARANLKKRIFGPPMRGPLAVATYFVTLLL
jgi:hypothetical protein